MSSNGGGDSRHRYSTMASWSNMKQPDSKGHEADALFGNRVAFARLLVLCPGTCYTPKTKSWESLRYNNWAAQDRRAAGNGCGPHLNTWMVIKFKMRHFNECCGSNGMAHESLNGLLDRTMSVMARCGDGGGLWTEFNPHSILLIAMSAVKWSTCTKIGLDGMYKGTAKYSPLHRGPPKIHGIDRMTRMRIYLHGTFLSAIHPLDVLQIRDPPMECVLVPSIRLIRREMCLLSL